jgi:hypothetical protein
VERPCGREACRFKPASEFVSTIVPTGTIRFARSGRFVCCFSPVVRRPRGRPWPRACAAGGRGPRRGKAHADEWRGRKVELRTVTMALAHPACREATNPSEC